MDKTDRDHQLYLLRRSRLYGVLFLLSLIQATLYMLAGITLRVIVGDTILARTVAVIGWLGFPEMLVVLISSQPTFRELRERKWIDG